MQNISGTNAVTWQHKLAADFPPFAAFEKPHKLSTVTCGAILCYVYECCCSIVFNKKLNVCSKHRFNKRKLPHWHSPLRPHHRLNTKIKNFFCDQYYKTICSCNLWTCAYKWQLPLLCNDLGWLQIFALVKHSLLNYQYYKTICSCNLWTWVSLEPTNPNYLYRVMI